MGLFSKADDEQAEPERYLMLDGEDFACLVRGGVLHCGTIKLALRDIGFSEMRNEIDHAELGKDTYKDHTRKG